jgi:hypothetical protein
MYSEQYFNLTWSPEYQTLGGVYVAITTLAILFHLLFWIQVATHQKLRQISMLWIYNYLFTDLVLLVQLLAEYITRRSLPHCIAARVFFLLCKIEAYTSLYMSILEAYMLVCLNVSRYFLIVKNCNISARYPSRILCFNVGLYIVGICVYIFQVEILEIVTLQTSQRAPNCHFRFRDRTNRIANIIVILVVPIAANIYLMIVTLLHVRRSEQAARTQVNVSTSG